MRAQVITANSKLFGVIDVVRTISNESTEPRESPFKSRPKSLTPPRSTEAWRTKDNDASSIFRKRSSDVPDMFTLKRCLAFDEDD
jgi:hypothetical protein